MPAPSETRGASRPARLLSARLLSARFLWARFLWARFIAAAVICTLASSCSLGVTARDECSSSDQCQAIFGFGSVCAGDGLCARAEVHPRCTQTFPGDLFTAPERYPDHIVIGNLMDRSLTTHQARERSAQLAIAQANDVGGVEERRFGIVFCTIEQDSEIDALTREEAAVETGRYLVETLGVPAIVGPAASGDTEAVFNALRDSGALVISPSATSPALTDIDVTSPTDETPGRLWRTAPPDSIQGSAIATDMSDRSVTNVAAVFVSGAYGEGLAQEFEASFTGSVDLFPFSNATERDAAVSNAGAGDYEEVLFIASQTTDAAAFLNATNVSTNYDGKQLFLSDGAGNADFLAMTAGASARYPQVRGSRPSTPSGFVYTAFSMAYAATFSVDVDQFSYTAHAYDAAWMVVYGVAWALLREGGVVSGETIARGLRQLSSGREFQVLSSSLQSIVNAFREGGSVDIQGASGELDYDAATEETRAPTEIWTIAADGRSLVPDRTIQP